MSGRALQNKNRDNERKFERIFSRYFNELVNFVFYQISDFEQAQEIVQDVFVRVHRNFDAITNDKQASNYLYMACKNAVKNEYRRRSRLKSGFGKTILVEFEKYEAFFDTKKSEEDDFLESEEKNKVMLCLEKLKQSDREIILMKEFMGKSYEEIAEIFNVGATAVRGRLYKARQRLRKLFEEEAIQ